MDKHDILNYLPQAFIKSGDKLNDVKKFINTYLVALNWLTHNTIDHRYHTIHDDTDWNDLKDRSLYYFDSLSGPNAPAENQMGNTKGIVLVTSAGIGDRFQLAMTGAGAAFRSLHSEWFYIGHGIPANVDINKLVDRETLDGILSHYYTKDQINRIVQQIMNTLRNDYFNDTKSLLNKILTNGNILNTSSYQNILQNAINLAQTRGSLVNESTLNSIKANYNSTIAQAPSQEISLEMYYKKSIASCSQVANSAKGATLSSLNSQENTLKSTGSVQESYFDEGLRNRLAGDLNNVNAAYSMANIYHDLPGHTPSPIYDNTTNINYLDSRVNSIGNQKKLKSEVHHNTTLINSVANSYVNKITFNSFASSANGAISNNSSGIQSINSASASINSINNERFNASGNLINKNTTNISNLNNSVGSLSDTTKIPKSNYNQLLNVSDSSENSGLNAAFPNPKVYPSLASKSVKISSINSLASLNNTNINSMSAYLDSALHIGKPKAVSGNSYAPYTKENWCEIQPNTQLLSNDANGSDAAHNVYAIASPEPLNVEDETAWNTLNNGKQVQWEKNISIVYEPADLKVALFEVPDDSISSLNPGGACVTPTGAIPAGADKGNLQNYLNGRAMNGKIDDPNPTGEATGITSAFSNRANDIVNKIRNNDSSIQQYRIPSSKFISSTTGDIDTELVPKGIRNGTLYIVSLDSRPFSSLEIYQIQNGHTIYLHPGELKSYVNNMSNEISSLENVATLNEDGTSFSKSAPTVYSYSANSPASNQINIQSYASGKSGSDIILNSQGHAYSAGIFIGSIAANTSNVNMLMNLENNENSITNSMYSYHTASIINNASSAASALSSAKSAFISASTALSEISSMNYPATSSELFSSDSSLATSLNNKIQFVNNQSMAKSASTNHSNELFVYNDNN